MEGIPDMQMDLLLDNPGRLYDDIVEQFEWSTTALGRQ